jgi:hypothetical protein
MGMGPDHIINSLNELSANSTEMAKFEAASALDDANTYADEQDALINKRVDQEIVDRQKEDQNLQSQIDRIEGQTHRAEWQRVNSSFEVLPGQISWRETTAWSGLLDIHIHYEDVSGRVHPLETIQEGNLFLIEWFDDQDNVAGSAVYVIGTIKGRGDERINFDPDKLVYAEGQPPQLFSNCKILFTPENSGGGDYWTKAESDSRYHIVGNTDNVLLDNGGLKPQSHWLVKGNSTDVQLSNGDTKSQSDFIFTSGTNQNFVLDGGGKTGKSNYHAKNTTNGGNYFLTANHNEVLKSDYHKKTTSTDVLLSNHTTVTQASLKGKTYPGTFTSSGSTLYWTP